MVIFKRDEYLSYVNSAGVKMPTPPTEIVPNGGSLQGINNSNINNNNNSTPSNQTATIKRDNSQAQLQQLQQYAQQQQQPNLPPSQPQQTNQQLAKAQLVCRPNSHPFPSRTLLLETGKPVKIGRAIARTKVSDNNAIFDCKVLSRNHAELWYDDGKFFLKDTGSSNGTFINNQRLSQTCSQSEPFEVSSGDIVQFGVDVMENSRKETHGCIVATLKLFLPDGRETKASQSTLVGASNTKIPQVDLYRLNQYIQEAIQREQNLESKLLNIQKKIDIVRKSSSTSWQALVDEDRLLSRIDMLEKKLLCFGKSLSEDKLREEIMKLHNEKMLYQTSAKAALKKVYNERMEAIQKLSNTEKALCSTEDECSLLRDQLTKTQSHSHDTNQRLDVIQGQLEDKCNDYEERIYKKDNELKSLSSELNDLQEKLTNYKHQNDVGDYGDSQLLTSWLLKSDIKNIEGSDDIIKAICDDEDEEVNLAKSLESNCSQIYNKMFTLEKELNMLFAATNNNNINNNNNDSNNESENSLNLSASESTATLTDHHDDHVPLLKKEEDDDENENEQDQSQQQQQQQQQQCDDNQNNVNDVNNRIVALQQNLDNLNIGAAGERIRMNLKQLLMLYAKLKRQLMEFTEAKANEQSSYKAKCDEMSSQLISLKLDLDSRPTQEDFDAKLQQCNVLRTELANLTEQMACNEKLLEQMQFELSEERERRMDMLDRAIEERGVQTDEQQQQQQIEKLNESTNKPEVSPPLEASSSVLTESPLDASQSSKLSSSSKLQQPQPEPSTNLPPIASPLDDGDDDNKDEDDDDELNNHPKVLYEDELIVFKEKCSSLTAETVRLQREIAEMRANMSQFHSNWMHNFMLKYLVPVLIVFLAYLFYLMK